MIKICHSSCLVITIQNLKILLSLLLLSHPTISKFYQLATWNFFRLVIQLILFWRLVETVAIIITIFSNITTLLSDNVISFGYFMPMSYGINKKAPTSVSPPSPPFPQPSFHHICLLFYKKDLINLFLLWSSRLLQIIIHFQSKTNFSFNLLMVGFDFAVLYLCVS